LICRYLEKPSFLRHNLLYSLFKVPEPSREFPASSFGVPYQEFSSPFLLDRDNKNGAGRGRKPTVSKKYHWLLKIKEFYLGWRSPKARKSGKEDKH
jgi:hypothetical protein